MVQNLIYTFALDCSFVYYKDTAKGSLSWSLSSNGASAVTYLSHNIPPLSSKYM